MKIEAQDKAVVVRFRYKTQDATQPRPGTKGGYSNQVNEITGQAEGNGPFEEVRVPPGDTYWLDDANTELISIQYLEGQTVDLVQDSPNGPGSE